MKAYILGNLYSFKEYTIKNW